MVRPSFDVEGSSCLVDGEMDKAKKKEAPSSLSKRAWRGTVSCVFVLIYRSTRLS